MDIKYLKWFGIKVNFNLWNSNIVDNSGAFFKLKIQYEYTQTQCEEGARDDNNIWVPVVTSRVSA